MGVDNELAHLHGTTTFFHGTYTAESVTITICCALAICNAIEVLVLVFATFRRYSGLYFWSLVVASSGVIPYVIGFMFQYFTLASQLVGEIVSTIGWPMMVTGQSLVLYSRLGVVLGPNHDRVLQGIKWMIIIDGLVFHISTTVVMFGVYNAHPSHQFALAYKYIEKIQMTGFTIQEFIISGLYVWRTLEMLKTVDVAEDRNRRRRRTTMELFSINIIIIIFDVALLVVEYQDRHVIEQALKGVVYSIKLKLEFLVLRKLVNMSKLHSQASQSTFATSVGDGGERGNSQISDRAFPRSVSWKENKHVVRDDILCIERVQSYLATWFRIQQDDSGIQPNIPLFSPRPPEAGLSTGQRDKMRNHICTMSSSSNTPRTRLGCQHCRRRHLKCDDLRPSCARCQKAGLQCNREYNIRFRHGANPSVKTTGSGSLEFDFRKSQPWVKTAPSLVFLDGTQQLKESYDHDSRYEGSAASPSTSEADVRSDPECYSARSPRTSNPRPTLEQANPPRNMDIDTFLVRGRQQRSTIDSSQVPLSSQALNGTQFSPFNTWHDSLHSEWTASPSGHLAASLPDLHSAHDLPADDLSLEVFETSTTDNSHAAENRGSETLPGIYLDVSAWPLSSKEEAGLLRYYVERLARDFDLSDPYRHFRNVVPQRAATCPLLLNAICALSARHLSRIGDYDPLVSNKYHQECLKRVIPVLNDSAAILDENLLASTIILRHLEEFEVPLSGYSPTDRQSHLLGSHAFIKAQKNATMSEGLRQASFWVGLRQEIHVAFMNQRTIAITIEDLNIDKSSEFVADHISSCRMVVLCADVIRFCFGEDDKLASEYQRLSDSVNEWYSSKNDSFTPVYYKEAEDEGTFPDIWFLNDEISIGWQHYYISKLLLCAHNPKVPRLGPGRASALRAIDEELKYYVKILCGMAMSNPDTAPNFTYAAMAIVAAGDKFTELYEQRALLRVLDICDSQYAFPTAYARENLKAAWNWTPDNV